MIILVNLIVLGIICVCVKILITACAGAVSVRQFQRKDSIMECRNGRLADVFTEIGISIIISNLKRKEDLHRLLSLDLIRYEIIVMIDSQRGSLAEDLIRDYSMIKIDQVPFGELPCISVRGVYRSCEGLFTRLVVVDVKNTEDYKLFNCGVNLARYEYVTAFNSDCHLNIGAICSVVREIMEQPFQSRAYAVGGFRVGRLPSNAVSIVDLLVSMVVTSAGFAKLSRWGAGMGIVQTKELGINRSLMMVFERERLIDAGGYLVNTDYDFDLYKRIKKINNRVKSGAQAIFVAKVFLFDSAKIGLNNTSSEAIPPFRNTALSQSFIIVFLIALAVTLTLSITLDDTYITKIIGLTLAFIYCTCLGLAAIAMSVSRRLILRSLGYKHTAKLLGAMLFYPFFMTIRLIKTIKF